MARPLFLVALLLAGCGTAAPPTKHVLVSGSRTLAPLLRAIGDRYAADHPGVKVDVEPALSAKGALDARLGLADVGLVARPLRPDETGLVGHPLGRDALAFVVHRDNPVATLNHQQLAAVFSRGLTSWRDLGGSDRPIELVGFAEGRAARESFFEYLSLKDPIAKADVVLPTSEQIAQAVAARPGAIGVVSLCSARAVLPTLSVRLLPLAGVSPDHETVSAARYPFVRTAVLATRPSPPAAVRDFVEYARSPELYELLKEHGLAPPLLEKP